MAREEETRQIVAHKRASNAENGLSFQDGICYNKAKERCRIWKCMALSETYWM